jgi:hypothetical protein
MPSRALQAGMRHRHDPLPGFLPRSTCANCKCKAAISLGVERTGCLQGANRTTAPRLPRRISPKKRRPVLPGGLVSRWRHAQRALRGTCMPTDPISHWHGGGPGGSGCGLSAGKWVRAEPIRPGTALVDNQFVAIRAPCARRATARAVVITDLRRLARGWLDGSPCGAHRQRARAPFVLVFLLP